MALEVLTQKHWVRPLWTTFLHLLPKSWITVGVTPPENEVGDEITVQVLGKRISP